MTCAVLCLFAGVTAAYATPPYDGPVPMRCAIEVMTGA
jgi:hypothetical protein